METRAIRFHGPGVVRLDTVTLAGPALGETVVRVSAAGVCGADLHFVAGLTRPRRSPITLGHEVAGVVETSRSAAWPEGSRVSVHADFACGVCRSCMAGHPMQCEHLVMPGVDVDGGLADRIVVPGDALLAWPEGVAAAEAAVAPDAAGTALHALRCRAGLDEGDAVLVVGIGGLGSFAVQIARILGAAPIVAADREGQALDRARTLGADETILLEPGRSLGRSVKLLTDGGVDVALDLVGASTTVDACVKSLRPGGVAVTAGILPEPLETLPSLLWARHEYGLVGAFGSHRSDVERVMAWLVDGRLRAPHIQRVALDAAADTILAAAEEGTHGGRIVVFSSAEGAGPE